jgi:translocation and assembly module TamB
MTMRRLLVPALALLLLAGSILLASALRTRSAEEDKGVLASLISRALSTPATRVSIGTVEGALSSDATIRDITISDRDGVWFRLDRARIVWRRLALLSKRLEIDRLEIGSLEVLRKPLPAEEAVPGADEPLLPELPVKVQIADFRLQKLTLGEPILGVAAQLSATGAASLGNPAEGLDLRFAAHRLDAPGNLTARLNYASERLDLTLALDEPEGGILARAASIPGLPPGAARSDRQRKPRRLRGSARLPCGADDRRDGAGRSAPRGRRQAAHPEHGCAGRRPAALRRRARLCRNDAAGGRHHLRQ